MTQPLRFVILETGKFASRALIMPAKDVPQLAVAAGAPSGVGVLPSWVHPFLGARNREAISRLDRQRRMGGHPWSRDFADSHVPAVSLRR